MAVNVVLLPIHIATSKPALAVGRGLTVIITSSLSVHPLPSVTVTVYVVVTTGETVVLAVVALLLHK